MTSFSWKRKAGEAVSRDKSTAFELDSKEEEDIEIESGVIDWLGLQRQAVKRPRLEDGYAKAARLKEEGSTLAGEERFWEALKKWDAALELTPDDAVIYEMKAQAYLALGEVYPALTAASRAVSLAPLWWPGHQTLGRAHLGLGEVRLALRCFQVAVHIHPDDQELWESDLKWAQSLLLRKQVMDDKCEALPGSDNPGPTVQPLDGESSDEEQDSEDGETTSQHCNNSKTSEDGSAAEAVNHLPNNYILMRDKVA